MEIGIKQELYFKKGNGAFHGNKDANHFQIKSLLQGTEDPSAP